jgi:transposase
MAKAYSQDLRDRVIDAVAGEGMKCREAGRRFGVGASTAIKWVERYRETGRRRPVSPAIGAEAASRFPGCGAG